MPVEDRPSGVRVSYPEGFRVERAPAPARRPDRRRGARLVPSSPPEAQRETRVLLEALSEQRLDVVDEMAVAPPAASRSRAPRPAGSLELEVPLGPEEHAVVLVEREGVYEWQLPEERRSPAPRSRRRGGAAEPGPASARFVIEVDSPDPAGPARRGVISDLVTGRIQAVVLKFAAHAVVGKAITHLERDVQPGLVVIDGADPGAWKKVESLDQVRGLPRGRRARILLLIHGTFSSTTGGFGGLAAHEHGRRLLAAAGREYDAVIGYDHRTLSLDPLENASDLLERLRVGGNEHPPRIDVVAHSRGGLVARSLSEHLLPAEPNWDADVSRTVFVACTNGGTLFASPAHWKTYVDLYTNLVMAAGRLVDLAAPPLVGTITRGAVSGVGAFVKYLVAAALDARDVPGLAAMDPGGTFVRQINETQPGQLGPEASHNFVITSDFEARGPETGPRELPPRLLAFLADAIIDGVFKGAGNDLVVDVEAMSEIDPQAGQFVDDRFDFGANGSVYHCNYFLRDEVAAAIEGWLGLDELANGGPYIRGPKLSAEVETTVLEVPAEIDVSDLLEAVGERSEGYVVVTRPEEEGGYRYAFSPDELRTELSDTDTRAVGEVLDLHESDSSPVLGRAEAVRGVGSTGAQRAARGLRRSRSRTVVVVGDRAVGVTPRPMAGAETAEALEAEAGPAPPQRARRRKRTPASPAHVAADMPPEIIAGKQVTLHVEVSPAPSGRPQGPTARAAVVPAEALDPKRPLIVQVVPRTNVEVVGEGRAELPVPARDDNPAHLFFDVKGVSDGEGEVWVIVRQDHPALLTLTLTPRVIKQEQRARRVLLRAEGGLLATSAGWALPTLRITDRESSDGVILQFELDLLQHGKWTGEKKASSDDRRTFVSGVYKDLETRWVGNEDDADAFLRDTRAYGGELLDRLIPKEVQEKLWYYRKELKHIQVVSTEPFIPWELVYLKNPATGRPAADSLFLGQMGLVRWLLNVPGAATRLRARPGKVRTIIPAYPDRRFALQETAAEGEFLARELGAKPVEPRSNPVFALLEKPGKVDVVHFAGHGLADLDGEGDAMVMLEGRVDKSLRDPYVPDYLRSITVRNTARLARGDEPERPLVFLNACQSGRLKHRLSSISGFADSFLQAGAGAFVSSLWNIGDTPAATFGAEFYTRLKAGDTVAEATVAAREKARSADDATWLAYVVYAHPDATLSTGASGS
jgi:CHAT domain-containing protein/uncharacterized protein associated with vWA-MoxR-VMAP ternary system